MSDTAVVKYNERFTTLKRVLEKAKPEIEKALPRHLAPERMIRVALTTIRKNPQLLNADVMSVVGAVMEAAQLGLEVDGVLGHAYLVPFRNRKAKRLEAVLIPGYRGLIDLAYRSGRISFVQAEVIYENDEFDYALGAEPYLRHKPRLGERGEPIGAWAMARMADGSVIFKVMSKEEILKHKEQSKAEGGDLWTKYWEWAWKKTVLRQLVKTLPLTPEATRAIIKEEYLESGHTEDIASEANGVTETEAAAIRVEQLKRRLAGEPEEAVAGIVEVPEEQTEHEEEQSETTVQAEAEAVLGAAEKDEKPKKKARATNKQEEEPALARAKKFFSKWAECAPAEHRIEWQTMLKMAVTPEDVASLTNQYRTRYGVASPGQMADLKALAEEKKAILSARLAPYGLKQSSPIPIPVYKAVLSAVQNS